MRNTGLNEAQTGIKNVRGNINNLRYADDTTLIAESTEGTYVLKATVASGGAVTYSWVEEE